MKIIVNIDAVTQQVGNSISFLIVNSFLYLVIPSDRSFLPLRLFFQT